MIVSPACAPAGTGIERLLATLLLADDAERKTMPDALTPGAKPSPSNDIEHNITKMAVNLPLSGPKNWLTDRKIMIASPKPNCLLILS
jgi:hypothetical protein